jgi:hypothetical protein
MIKSTEGCLVAPNTVPLLKELIVQRATNYVLYLLEDMSILVRIAGSVIGFVGTIIWEWSGS